MTRNHKNPNLAIMQQWLYTSELTLNFDSNSWAASKQTWTILEWATRVTWLPYRSILALPIGTRKSADIASVLISNEEPYRISFSSTTTLAYQKRERIKMESRKSLINSLTYRDWGLLLRTLVNLSHPLMSTEKVPIHNTMDEVYMIGKTLKSCWADK